MSLFNNKKREIKIIEFDLANWFVAKYHRHNKPCTGHIFSIGLFEYDKLIGVAICGRPVSRFLDNGDTMEINRVCTDGSRNANSQLYSYCKKLSKAKKFTKVITYTLQSESGASLRAINAKIEKVVEHTHQWNDSENVKRNTQEVTILPKYRWVL